MASSPAVCMTPACARAASEYLHNLSPNYKKIDACSDFEELVCEGWRGSHDMRPDQGQVNVFRNMSDVASAISKRIIEGAYPYASNHSTFSPRNLAAVSASVDQQNFELLQTAYKACMDQESIAKTEIAPLVSLLDQLAASFNGSDWVAPSKFLEQLGMSSFLSFGVREDVKTPDDQIIAITGPSTGGLPDKKYYTMPDIAAEYQAAMAKVLAVIQPSKAKIGDASKAAADIFKLESRMAAITPERTEARDITKTYNPMHLADVTKLIPQLGLETLIKSFVPANYTPDRVIVSFPAVVSNLSSIIADTPKETLQNFLYWKVIQRYGSYLKEDYMKPYTRFKNTLDGKEPDAVTDRWRTCLGFVDAELPWILSRFWIEAAYSEKAKNAGNQIISDIKATYIKKFNALPWMDDSVKKVAVDKVRNIDQKIGYPSMFPNIMDPQDLFNYYSSINVTNAYFANGLAFDKYDAAKSWARLGKPTNKQEWGMSSPTVNAYYQSTHNEIVFPAGIMQFPMFDVDLPSYVNYGGFGAVAGHELSHAFDNRGRLSDANGAYQDWWTNRTIAEYTKRANCLIGQFANFTVNGTSGPVHVNGELTQGENIADSAGISASWAAWQDHRKSSGEKDLVLPGLEMFSPEQLFFVAFGNIWCSKYKPAMLTNRILTDAHSPDMIRIKGTLQNSRAFREVFNCPVKEPTCELW